MTAERMLPNRTGSMSFLLWPRRGLKMLRIRYFSKIELASKVESLETKLAKKLEELTDEVVAAKADKTIWVRGYTIQQFPASSPILKLLDEYLPAKEEEVPAAGTSVNQSPTDEDMLVIQDLLTI